MNSYPPPPSGSLGFKSPELTPPPSCRAMAMPGPSLGAGEEVLITAHAVHKKSSGTVWFTTRRALWRAADGKAAVQRVEVPWAAVKSFQVCARGSVCVAV